MKRDLIYLIDHSSGRKQVSLTTLFHVHTYIHILFSCTIIMMNDVDVTCLLLDKRTTTMNLPHVPNQNGIFFVDAVLEHSCMAIRLPLRLLSSLFSHEEAL